MSVIRVAIVGRPNVGKSTLFNRLLGRRRSIVHDMPGVTRDRIEEQCLWTIDGKRQSVLLIDTGGLGHPLFENEIEDQVNIAMSDADIVLFLCDSQEGLTPMDEAVLKGLREGGVLKNIPIALLANKMDDHSHDDRIHDYYATGIETILPLSAEHNRGVETIKEWAVRTVLQSTTDNEESLALLEKEFSESVLQEPLVEAETENVSGPTRIAVVGRPNVGKSTFVNALLGKQRMITSPIAGTTSDSVDSYLDWDGVPTILVDTAGVRRKSKTERGIEVLSVVQTKKTLERADIALLLLDGGEGITDQDEKIGGLIEDAGTSVILVMNKWDLHGQTGFKREDAVERIRKQMAFLKYAPILFISAKNGKGFDHIKELIQDILQQKQLKVTTKEFSEWVRHESTIHNPFNAKFYLSHQAGRHPPTFVSHVSDPKKVHFSLRRHLVNAIREKWGFVGSPIRMIFRSAENSRPQTRPSPGKQKTSDKRVNES